MKHPSTLSIAALLCTAGFSMADPVYTTPVGYVTIPISPAFGAGNPKFNFIAPSLQNSASVVAEISDITGDVITLSGVTLAANEFAAPSFGYGTAYSFFAETSDGYWSNIISNTASSITIESGAGSNFVVGESVAIRKHLTVNDVFGANNEAGLLGDEGGDTGEADNLILIDEINGGTITIIASDAIGGAWITDAFEDAGEIPIYPDQGIQVLRRALADLEVVVAGEVDVNGRQIEVTSGVQLRPYVHPADTTLTALELYTGDPATGVVGSASGDSGEADQVTVVVGGIPSIYFYSEIDLTGDGPGWYDDALNFVGDVNLPAGVGLIINRSNDVNSNPFIWSIPGPVIGN